MGVRRRKSDLDSNTVDDNVNTQYYLRVCFDFIVNNAVEGEKLIRDPGLRKLCLLFRDNLTCNNIVISDINACYSSKPFVEPHINK